MTLSLKAMFLAGALFAAIGFVVITLLNLLLRPFGGAFLVLLASLYPGYDPVNWPIGIIVSARSIHSWQAVCRPGFSAGSIIFSALAPDTSEKIASRFTADSALAGLSRPLRCELLLNLQP
jgi:hypothetical protein